MPSKSEWRKAAERAHKTRQKEIVRISNMILILECLPTTIEKCSEGQWVKNQVEILNRTMIDIRRGKKNTWITDWKVRGREDFLGWMEDGGPGTIHISAHGYYNDYKKESVIVMPRYGKVYSSELKGIWRTTGKTPPDLIIMSACWVGRKDMAECLYDSGSGCRNFIAPKNDVPFNEAMLFLTPLYDALFIEQTTPGRAFEKAMQYHRNYGKWQFYREGELV